jgi:hypothetical protein
MNRDIRALSLAVTFAALGIVAPAIVKAVVIEGFKPNGQYAAVGLDSKSRLLVADTSTDTPKFVVVTNTITAYAIQSGGWLVSLTSGTNININASSTVQVAPSTAATLTGTQLTFNGSSVINAAPTAKGTLICNLSITLVWFGGDNTAGTPLAYGSCFSPDVPSTFIGAIQIYSTAPATISILRVTP